MADTDSRTEAAGSRRPSPPARSRTRSRARPAWTGACRSRLARVFRPSTNRTVMLAIDHGYFQGPTTGLERVDL